MRRFADHVGLVVLTLNGLARGIDTVTVVRFTPDAAAEFGRGSAP